MAEGADGKYTGDGFKAWANVLHTDANGNVDLVIYADGAHGGVHVVNNVPVKLAGGDPDEYGHTFTPS